MSGNFILQNQIYWDICMIEMFNFIRKERFYIQMTGKNVLAVGAHADDIELNIFSLPQRRTKERICLRQSNRWQSKQLSLWYGLSWMMAARTALLKYSKK